MADDSLADDIKCKACGVLKPRVEFYTRRWVVQPCKQCCACQSVERARQRRKRDRETRPPQLCACGCRETVPYNKAIPFKPGHQSEKVCKQCGETKPIDQFSLSGWRIRANGERRRYRAPHCKSCSNERRRNTPGTRAKKAAYQRKYRLRDLESFKIAKRISRQNNKESHNARSRRWVEANLEKRRLTLVISEQRRRLEQGWNKKSPAIRQAIEQTLELARFGDQYLDAYTGELIDKPTIDHIMPISAGGTNDADNLCVTSLSNNSSKCDDSLIVWLVKRAQYAG